MSAFDLNAIISQLGRDKGIDRQAIVELIESAVLSAAKKHYGHNVVLETQFNEDSGEVEVLQFKTVVE
jgi:N utilization substance protein A